MKKLLIGGQALRNLGSDRHTEDVDFLINYTTSTSPFLHDSKSNTDYCNANGNEFFKLVWESEKNNTTEQASAQAIFELKAYSFVQHCQNGSWAKVDSTEYDIKFLVRNCGVKTLKIANKFMTAGQLAEIMKIVQQVKF